MIKAIIQKWEENKSNLEEYFRNTEQDEYGDYETIVKKIFELVINYDHNAYENFAVDKMTVIDNGDYQGTQIFIIPKDTYQPDADDYIVTHTYYGSCSGCDTLQDIGNCSDEKPNDEQVSEYMTLALHLVQKMKWLDSDD